MTLLARDATEPKSDINYSVATRVKKSEDEEGLYESILDIKVVSKLSDGTEVFKLALEYIGLFKLSGEATQELTDQVLLVNGMELIFPFARREISALILSAGHEPVLLDPVNFKKAYSEHKAKKLTASKNKKKEKESF